MSDDRSLRHELADLLDRSRARTLSLLEPLADDEIHAQPVDFLSPLVWDVGHIACFEELWLVREPTGRPSTDPARDRLYDAFENPRWTRGDLPLLPREDAIRYLADVRDESLGVLGGLELAPDEPLLADGRLHRMVAQHESQHQETMLQGLAIRDTTSYRRPRLGGLREMARIGGLREMARGVPPAAVRPVDDRDRVVIDGGPFPLGTDDRRWSYDNERPQHVVDVPTFALDRFPVTCRRFAAFVEAGGYERPDLWSERGWRWLQDSGHSAPQGWRRSPDGQWLRVRFGHVEPLDPREPVQHVSWFEAEAFACWAGGRLPTEAEWEKAASWDPAGGTKRRFPWGDAPPTPRRANLGASLLGPVPIGSYPAGASAYGVEQLAGDVYEWTASPFDGYPGFAAFPYREYSEVFFGGDHRVLRGSSWAIAPALARVTYRNWDHPYRRQIFAGLRLAYDVPS